jgi:DNA transformation protein
MTAISTIRNLGPAMETALIDAGIANAETLREVGANAAYCNLLENGQRPHFIEYYVMHMALQGRPWNG